MYTICPGWSAMQWVARRVVHHGRPVRAAACAAVVGAGAALTAPSSLAVTAAASAATPSQLPAEVMLVIDVGSSSVRCSAWDTQVSCRTPSYIVAPTIRSVAGPANGRYVSSLLIDVAGIATMIGTFDCRHLFSRASRLDGCRYYGSCACAEMHRDCDNTMLGEFAKCPWGQKAAESYWRRHGRLFNVDSRCRRRWQQQLSAPPR